VLARFREAAPEWRRLLERSFLSSAMKAKFVSLLEARAQRCLA
jgi:hypothetical protein